MNFGIIGYGKMGKLYHNVLSSKGINIEFICDKIKQDITEKFFLDPNEALEKSEVDGIIISTHGPSHYEIMNLAIRKNIPYIVCEKPFTVSVKQADKIIEHLKNSKSRLIVNYSRRFSDSYTELKKDLFEKKIIGEPSSIVFTCGAGGLSAVGTHFFDLGLYLFGKKIKNLYAVSVDRNLPNPRGIEFKDPGGYVIISFENDKRMFMDLGDDLGIQPIIEIIGEYGRVIIDDVNDNIVVSCRSHEDMKKPKHCYGLQNNIIKNETFGMGSLKELIEKMLDNLLSNSKILSTAEMAKKNVEIYSAIQKSFEINAPVSLPLNDKYYEKEFMVTWRQF